MHNCTFVRFGLSELLIFRLWTMTWKHHRITQLSGFVPTINSFKLPTTPQPWTLQSVRTAVELSRLHLVPAIRRCNPYVKCVCTVYSTRCRPQTFPNRNPWSMNRNLPSETTHTTTTSTNFCLTHTCRELTASSEATDFSFDILLQVLFRGFSVLPVRML